MHAYVNELVNTRKENGYLSIISREILDHEDSMLIYRIVVL